MNQHHGDGKPIEPEFIKMFRKEMTGAGTPLGATETFPRGRLNADDEGELRYAIADKEGKVILDFGKPIVWLGMDPEHAEALAALLLEHAKHARG